MRYVIDKDELVELADEAERRGYNRQLNTQAVRLLEADALFLIEPLLLHEHIAGKRTDDLHYRCMIRLIPSGRILGIIDVPTSVFTEVKLLDHTSRPLETESELTGRN